MIQMSCGAPGRRTLAGLKVEHTGVLMSAPFPLRPEPLPGQTAASHPSASEALPPNASAPLVPAATEAAANPALPEAWRPDPAGDRLPALLGFALAVEKAAVTTPLRVEDIPARRAEADRLLTEWAFRHLHNRLDEIRRDAVAEALARQPRPPGFATLLLANLLALALVGGALWLAGAGIALPGR